MKKSTKVKSKKVIKPSASPRKKLKKYEEGGKEVQGIKRKDTWDSFPGSNMPLAPKGDAVTMNLKSEPVPANKQLKKIELPAGSPDFSGQGAYAVTPAKIDEKKVETVSTPKAKRIAGGFSSEAQKAAYIKSVKARMSKGATIDQLVKERVGTKAGLEALGFKDTAKSTPLKNKKAANDLKQKGLQMKKQGAELKKKGASLKEKAGDKQYWKSKYYQDLVNKAASGNKLTSKERDLVWDKTTKKQDYGQKISDKESMARNKILKGATDKGREVFTDAAITTASIVAPGVIGKALGRGIKALKAAKAAKVLKVDKIIKPITKQIPRSTNAGKTIKVNGRTVSEGSQKLLGNGQKMLGNGQKMLGNTKGLPVPKKGLPAPKSSSSIKSGSAVKARENRIVARSNKSAKIESSIKTNNPVSRSMVRTRKTNELVKQGKQKIVRGAKSMKNSKPKPGDQLKLNLRKGGKVTRMRRGGKK